MTATADGTTKGTPLYMSPEQASGKAIDFRTDLWSLGAVLYEMLAGGPPYRGETQLQVMRAIVDGDPPRLRDARPGLPAEIDAIVSQALQKDPAKRYQSAAEMGNDLSAALTALEAPAGRVGLRAVYIVPAVVLILLAAGISVWFYQRSEKRHWAREQMPEIVRLTNQKKPLAAYRLLQEAQKYLPGDPQVAQIAEGLTHAVSVRSSPPGASVEIKDYLSPGDAWFPLGTTPLDHVKIPNGYLRWRVSKAGVGEYIDAPEFEEMHGYIPKFSFALDAGVKATEGMAAVPATKYFGVIWSLGDLGPFDLPAFSIDRFEVTNRQYQEFIDKGGYQKREYWKENFFATGRN